MYEDFCLRDRRALSVLPLFRTCLKRQVWSREWLFVHVVAGTATLVLGPVQFWPGLKQKLISSAGAAERNVTPATFITVCRSTFLPTSLLGKPGSLPQNAATLRFPRHLPIRPTRAQSKPPSRSVGHRASHRCSWPSLDNRFRERIVGADPFSRTQDYK